MFYAGLVYDLSIYYRMDFHHSPQFHWLKTPDVNPSLWRAFGYLCQLSIWCYFLNSLICMWHIYIHIKYHIIYICTYRHIYIILYHIICTYIYIYMYIYKYTLHRNVQRNVQREVLRSTATPVAWSSWWVRRGPQGSQGPPALCPAANGHLPNKKVDYPLVN